MLHIQPMTSARPCPSFKTTGACHRNCQGPLLLFHRKLPLSRLVSLYLFTHTAPSFLTDTLHVVPLDDNTNNTIISPFCTTPLP
jgi:hypothetical protein